MRVTNRAIQELMADCIWSSNTINTTQFWMLLSWLFH